MENDTFAGRRGVKGLSIPHDISVAQPEQDTSETKEITHGKTTGG